MIDVRDIGRDFMPRPERPEEGFMQPGMPQAPPAPQPTPSIPIGGGVSTGQPAPFQPLGQVTGRMSPPGEIPQARSPGAERTQAIRETGIDPWTGQPATPSEMGVGPMRTQPGGMTGTAGPLQQGLPPSMQQPGGMTGTAGGLQQGLPPGMTMEQMRGAMGGGGVLPGGGVPGAPGTPEAGGFPYPEQWQTATDIYGRLAEGMPGMTPEYAQQAWLPYKRRAEEGALQAREAAGMTGMRWGTPLAGQIESIWGGAGERFGSEMERMRMQDIAGQRATMLQAAGGLGGLGGQYAQLPLTVSESMMRQGFTQQQMQQQELDRQREEWMRQQPEYSPWLQYQAPGAFGMPTGPEMYGPSFGGQMLDIGSQMAMYNMLNPSGGGVPTAPMGGGYYPPEWGQPR